MGGGIDPRIALGVQVPQIEGPIDMAKGGLSVQQLINTVQLQKQQQASAAIAQQQQQIELQQQQQNQKDTQAFNKAWTDAGGDWDTAIKNATANGVSGTFLTQKQMQRADIVAKTAAATKAQRENELSSSNELAKIADDILQTDPDSRASKYQTEVNGLVLRSNGAYKLSDFPATVPDDNYLKGIVAHNKALQDIHKEAAEVAAQNAKLPGEQAESLAKAGASIAQMMGKPQNQIGWTAFRNFISKSQIGQAYPDLVNQIPENYSPEAVEQVRQMGISPEKMLTGVPVEKLELADFMRNPPKGFKATPVDFLRYQKTVAPAFNINMQATGGGLGPTGGGNAPNSQQTPGNGTPSAPANAPGGWVSSSGKTLNNVPPAIRGEVQQVLEYRRADPSITQRGLVGQAINSWVADLDPTHDSTTFGGRNKALTEYEKSMSSGQLGAINTAIGHLGELNTAAKAVEQNDVPLLNSIANRLGLAAGSDAQSTYTGILHRVGPELTSAYVKGGGGQAERGANEADFDISKGAKQIQSNIAESAMLLNSKISPLRQNWQDTFRPVRDRDQFDNRWMTPAAKQTLQEVQANAPTNKKAGGLQIGQTVSIKGKQMKVTAVHPDGSFDAQ